MRKITLVSHLLCPYVQRAAIALTEKSVPFERIYVDLSDKPDWFKKLSPLGKVPLLKVEENGTENVIFESAVILEYLEETTDHPMHPSDPLERAHHRSWMEFGSSILNAISRLYNAKDQEAFDKECGTIQTMFERLEGELETRDTENSSGPYFAGEAFSHVDTVFGPVFRYFTTFENAAGLHLLDQFQRVKAWRQALEKRPSVINAVTNEYPELLSQFLLNRNSVISTQVKSVA